jgi:hypothetical protein
MREEGSLGEKLSKRRDDGWRKQGRRPHVGEDKKQEEITWIKERREKRDKKRGIKRPPMCLLGLKPIIPSYYTAMSLLSNYLVI